MPFALDFNPTNSELSEAVNYLLGNFSTGVSSNSATGQIVGPSGQVIGYLYQYMAVKYADSPDGSVNFSNVPTNRLYYGLNNNNNPTESSNPADYIWYQASGGFGTTKSLWYQSTGGRQIQFAVSVSAPDVGWVVDPGISIDLDVVTSGNIPVVVESFVPYFTPTILQVPRSGNPLSPSFTGIVPAMYATDKGAVVPFVDAQTDTAVNFTNGTWRIGNSSTTGYGDISKTNITIGDPTDAGDFAQWPTPSAMPNSPAYITVPVRYKNSLGVVAQAGVATLQLVFADPGASGSAGPQIDISGYTGFSRNAGGAFTPATATLSAITTNVTSPTYSWSITGATPTSSTSSSVVITPTSSATAVTVVLTVNGSNLTGPISKTIQMPVVYDGAPGQAGANGQMSAFPTIYIWTGSSVPPVRPSTTSTYTWSTGAYTAPSGWSTQPPSNTTAGNYLWSITVPLTVSATTTTSTLDWTDTSFPIRAIAYNGTNGINGTNGTNGINGTNGVNGTRTAVLDVYRWSASVPTTFPSGTSTYTWATGQFTAPGTLNGWSLTPPAPVAGQTLYIARQIYADTNTTATSTVSWTTTTANPLSASGTNGTNGANGANGTRTAVLEVYQWAATPPVSFPSGTSTYTWADGSFTAPGTPNGWSLTPGAPTPGFTLYACSVSYADTNTTATSTVTWSTNTAYVVGFAGTNGNNGANGTNGTRTAILEMYQWAATAPTSFPAGTSTYTWANGQFTAPGTPNGWFLVPPAAVVGQTLWVCRTIYADTNVSATSTVTWNATVAYPTGASGINGSDGANGANGFRTAFLEMYQWAATTPTAFPSGNSTYTWATGQFTNPTTPNGWSLTPGSSSPGFYLYACSVRYTDNTTNPTAVVTWNTGTAYVIGSAGSNGTNGTNGTNGAATFVVTRVANDSSAPSNPEVAGILGRNPVAGDICTVSYNNFNNAVVYRYTTSWALFQTYITGSLIVQNTITGDNIAANTITGTKIAANTITASNIAANTITSSQIAAATISANNMAANSITAANAAIANAAVNTLQIAGQAVTIPTSVYTAGSVSYPTNGTLVLAQTLTYTSTGAPTIITASVQSGGSEVYLLMHRNGSFLAASNRIFGGFSAIAPITYSVVDNPPAGSVIYDLYVYRPGTSSFSQTVNSRFLSILEVKR